MTAQRRIAGANDILLRSSQDVSTHTSRSESQSGEVGITIGTEAGIGVYVAAAMAKGRGDGSGLVHNETVVTAANGLTFVSGNDTTLQGAQLIGETVTGRVGGDFTLISEQDADRFDRKDTAISGSAAVGAGGGSANIAFSQSKVNSEYLSVREQTGVQAGGGGFDIEVGGHTQLDGAALASTSHNNRLSTGTLGWSDLENRAEYSASSISFSAGTNSNSSGASGSFSPGLSLPQSDSASSTTRAGIAAGTIEVREGPVDLSGLNRDVTALQQQGLDTIFDERKVAERMEMGQVAGEVGFRAVGDFVMNRQKEAASEYAAAQGRFDDAKAAGDQAGMANALVDMAAAQGTYESWQDGSARKTTLHLAMGGLQAAFGGGDALAGALGAAASEWTVGQTDSALLGLAAGLAAGAGAGNGGAGLATGLAGYTYNRQLHKEEQEAIDRLMAQGYDRQLINAVACNVAKCWEGSDFGVMAEVVKEQTSSVMDSLSPQQQSELLSVLRAEAPGLFRYTIKDYVADGWKENPGLQDGLVRAGGMLQALGGYGTAVVGGGLIAGGGSTCLATGVGCLGAAAGTGMLVWGTDQMAAGASTAWAGTLQPTAGGWALQQIAGMSPENAELAYGVLGMAPTAAQAFVINRAVNAEAAANAFARATYVNPLITRNSEAYFWSGLGRGGDVVAGDIASARGGVTLEKLLSTRDVNMPVWNASDSASIQAWRDASRTYAENASGTVKAVTGNNLRPGNIWETVELPALKANPKVNRIYRVDPVTGVETLIYSRR